MHMTRKQEAILAGSILGDAFLQKTGARNARLRFEHGAKQKEYLLWKAKAFPRLFQGRPTHLSRVHPKTKVTYEYWRAQSNAMPELGKWQSIFYPKGKKQIPATLAEFFTEPLALAVWYMDDGYYNPKDKNSFLYLGRVSREEAMYAREALVQNFGLAPRVYDKKQKGFALYFGVAETKKLHDVVRRHMLLPLFAYKLGDTH
jgi:hypothetical protein